MNALDLVARFEGVRRTGQGRWRAICPAHESRHCTPSLALRETDDGRVLLFCHAGCHADAVLGAVGLSVVDLFPPRPERYDVRQPRSGIHPTDVLACLVYETTVVLLAASDLLAGRALNEADHERLRLATQRIHAAQGVAHV